MHLLLLSVLILHAFLHNFNGISYVRVIQNKDHCVILCAQFCDTDKNSIRKEDYFAHSNQQQKVDQTFKDSEEEDQQK